MSNASTYRLNAAHSCTICSHSRLISIFSSIVEISTLRDYSDTDLCLQFDTLTPATSHHALGFYHQGFHQGWGALRTEDWMMALVFGEPGLFNSPYFQALSKIWVKFAKTIHRARILSIFLGFDISFAHVPLSYCLVYPFLCNLVI